jgi:hypothetical protein
MPSMTNTDHGSQTNADNEEIILGVDTHKDTHVASVITVLACTYPAPRSRPPPPATADC